MLFIIGFIVIYVDKVGVMVKCFKVLVMYYSFVNCWGIIWEGFYNVGEWCWRFVVIYWMGYIYNKDVFRCVYLNVFYCFMGIMIWSVIIEMMFFKVMFQKVMYGNDLQGRLS